MLRAARVPLICGLLISTLSAIWLSRRLSACLQKQEHCIKVEKPRHPDSIDEVAFPSGFGQAFGKPPETSLRQEILWEADRRDTRSFSLKLRPFRINSEALDATFINGGKDDAPLPTCEFSTYLLLLIPSAPANFKQREFIRTTWANELYGGDGWSHFGKQHEKVQIIFLIGSQERVSKASKRATVRPNASAVPQQLAEESSRFRDILWLDVLDTYRNLTLKVLAGLEYACGACLSRYVLKVDDDVFVALPLVLSELRQREIDLVRTAFHGFSSQRNPDDDQLRAAIETRLSSSALFQGASALADSVLCAVNPLSRVHREGEWGVSTQDYPPDTWPPYCAGNAYLTSSRVVCRLAWTARHVPLLLIEDAFITGVLVRAAGVQHVNFDSRMTRWGTRMPLPCEMLAKRRLVATNFKLEDGYDFWLQLQETKCTDS